MEGWDMGPDVSAQTFEPFETEWSEGDGPTVAIIEAVAEATDQPPSDLEPLQEHIDGDALERLLTESSAPLTLSFVYEAVHIRVSTDNTISVWAE